MTLIPSIVSDLYQIKVGDGELSLAKPLGFADQENKTFQRIYGTPKKSCEFWLGHRKCLQPWDLNFKNWFIKTKPVLQSSSLALDFWMLWCRNEMLHWKSQLNQTMREISILTPRADKKTWRTNALPKKVGHHRVMLTKPHRPQSPNFKQNGKLHVSCIFHPPLP